MAGLVPELEPDGIYQTRLNALAWRSDATAAHEIEARLANYGFDQPAINTEVYAQARDLYLMFEGLIASAQGRSVQTLRDIQRHRKRSIRAAVHFGAIARHSAQEDNQSRALAIAEGHRRA